MWVMAVVALYQSFVDSMMERPVELLPHFLMAAVAELRRLFLHQKLTFLRMVGRVAIYAAHVVLQVRGASVVAVLLSVCMASQAARADFRSRSVLESENLGLVATTIDVCLPWTVARLTTMPLRPFFRIQRRHIVR